MASRAIVQRGVPVVAALILAAGCATTTPAPEYAGICVDPVTSQRVDDGRCGEPDDDGLSHAPGGFYFLWFPATYGGSVPAVGGPVTRSTVGGPVTTIRKGAPVARGVPKAGGSMPAIVRGGLGVQAGGKGGGS